MDNRLKAKITQELNQHDADTLDAIRDFCQHQQARQHLTGWEMRESRHFHLRNSSY